MHPTVTKPFERLTSAERQILLVPATVVAILIELIIIARAFDSGLDQFHRVFSLLVGAAGIACTWLLYRSLYPQIDRYPWLHWGIVLFNASALGLLSLFLREAAGLLVDALAIVSIFVTAILSGRWMTYLLIVLLTSIHMANEGALIPSDFPQSIRLLGLPLIGIVINETVLRLGGAVSAKVRRLETLNRLSRKIASTIEVDQVISLVSDTVQEAIPADTYYIGLVHGDSLRLELFYDDGELFPPQDIPLKGGLGGWVLENRRSLRLDDLPREAEMLGLEIRVIGKPKTSLSWIGTPMVAGNHLIGIMAMASYQRSAFAEADLELLQSMANQAALVIDNAYHHEEVERQSRLDSLTQVYNHGNLLAYLEEFTRNAHLNQSPLSLIMLDVDLFKQYNDTYGHLVGDQALNQVVAAVRQNTRSSDIVGRWGGEEFVVILPGTHGNQAMQVASRIRQTLRTLSVVTPDGRHVPVPTVSQGIAVFSEAPEAVKLVDLADQRLYIAKERGRDQVEPGESHWDYLAESA